MSLIQYRYPLDKTGLSPNNLVVGEEHQLSTRTIRCIAPTYGGFFGESAIVRNSQTGIQLVKGVDYNFGELFEFPTGRYGKEIFGIIIIYNTAVTRVSITYQALGGNYSYSMDAVIAMIDSLDLGERPVAWGDIVGRPALFDPASHLHDIGDIYGFEYVVHAIERLRQAVLLGDVASHDEIYNYIDQWGDGYDELIDALRAEYVAHRDDYENPHRVTKAQVGLGSVQNYGLATEAAAREGTSNAAYMTPLRTAQAINTQATIPLNNHIADKSNPHAVTKAQVGLGSVQNYAIATAAEATAGTATNKYMTPALTVNTISQHAVVPLNNHMADKSNPHQVTKTQVGLGNVSNFPLATTAQATAGTVTEAYMTPALARAATSGAVSAGLYDGRFVTVGQTRAASVHVAADQSSVSMWINGALRQIWPPLWQ